MEYCSTATWVVRCRNDEAGGFGAEVKPSDKACVCETFGSGRPNLDIAWLAVAFLICN